MNMIECGVVQLDEKAVNDFNQDWYSMYGDNIGICDLKD